MKSLVELVILVQKDDEEAFAQIVNKFKPLLIKESCRNGVLMKIVIRVYD